MCFRLKDRESYILTVRAVSDRTGVRASTHPPPFSRGVGGTPFWGGDSGGGLSTFSSLSLSLAGLPDQRQVELELKPAYGAEHTVTITLSKKAPPPTC